MMISGDRKKDESAKSCHCVGNLSINGRSSIRLERLAATRRKDWRNRADVSQSRDLYRDGDGADRERGAR